MVTTEDLDIESNFWDLYPEFKIAGPTKKLYTSDKSRNKCVSSKKMWCIALIWDRSSKYFNLPEFGEDGKVDFIMEDYGDPSWFKKNKEEFFALRDYYLKLQETPAMKALRGVEEKMLERDQFLRDTKYDIGIPNDRGQLVGGTADTLDKMMANTVKIWDLYAKAKSIANEEKSMSTKGDIKESLGDSGDI